MARQLAGCMGTQRQEATQPGNRPDQSSRDRLMFNYGIRYQCTAFFHWPAPGRPESPLSSSVVPRPATAAFAADYPTAPTGPVNTSLQGWEQVMHCGPVRGKSLLSAASTTR